MRVSTQPLFVAPPTFAPGHEPAGATRRDAAPTLMGATRRRLASCLPLLPPPRGRGSVQAARMQARAQSTGAYHGEEMRRSLAWMQERCIGLVPEQFLLANLHVWIEREAQDQPEQVEAFTAAAQAILNAYAHRSSELQLTNVPCRSLPQCIGQLKELRLLSLSGCGQLESLPDTVGLLEHLKTLDLAGCAKLRKVPSSVGKLEALKVLRLFGCATLASLPAALGGLSQLQALDIGGCPSLLELPDTLAMVRGLEVLASDMPFTAE